MIILITLRTNRDANRHAPCAAMRAATSSPVANRRATAAWGSLEPLAARQPNGGLPVRIDFFSDINKGLEAAMNYHAMDRFMMKVLWWHFAFAGLMAGLNSVGQLAAYFPSPFSWRLISVHEAIGAMVIGLGAVGIPALLRGTLGSHYAWRILVTMAETAQITAPNPSAKGVLVQCATDAASRLPSGIMAPKTSDQIPMTRPRISSGTMVCRTVFEVEKNSSIPNPANTMNISAM